MSWRWLAGWALVAILSTWVLGYLWLAMPGAVPVAILFGWFWWARPMSWESEFAFTADRLLRKAR